MPFNDHSHISALDLENPLYKEKWVAFVSEDKDVPVSVILGAHHCLETLNKIPVVADAWAAGKNVINHFIGKPQVTEIPG
jgi:hypothetical protein